LSVTITFNKVEQGKKSIGKKSVNDFFFVNNFLGIKKKETCNTLSLSSKYHGFQL